MLLCAAALDGELAGVRQSLALEQRSVARHLEVYIPGSGCMLELGFRVYTEFRFGMQGV